MDVKQTKFILKDFCFNLEIFLSEINCLIASVPETVLEIGKKNHICQDVIYKFFQDLFATKKTNSAVAFNCRFFPNILEKRECGSNFSTIWEKRLLYAQKPSNTFIFFISN